MLVLFALDGMLVFVSGLGNPLDIFVYLASLFILTGELGTVYDI